MTGQQLRSIREARGETREAFAAFLGDCSASTVNKWERDLSPVPAWVAEKAISKLTINLPIDDLQELIDYARAEDVDFIHVLGDAIRELLARRKNPRGRATSVQSTMLVDTPGEYGAKGKRKSA